MLSRDRIEPLILVKNPRYSALMLILRQPAQRNVARVGVQDQLEQQRRFDAGVILVEEAASGVRLVQQLTEQGLRSVKAAKPQGETQMRMHAQSRAVENGFVWVPREAHWHDAYRHELSIFPAGKHSDQVDSTSQALEWMNSRHVDPEVMAKAIALSLELAKRQAEERRRFCSDGSI